MLKQYVYPKKKSITWTLIIKMLSTLLGIFIPTILAHIIDDVVPRGDRNGVILFGSLMILVAILQWWTGIKSNRMAAKISSDSIQEIRKDLFDRSIRLSARQIDKMGVSSIESRLTSDTYTVHNFLGTALRMGSRSIMLFVGGVLFCVILSPKLSLVLLAIILPIFTIIRLIFNKTQPLWKELQNRYDSLVQVIRESIRGIKVSKALNKIEDEKEKFYKSSDAARQTSIKATDTMAMTSPLVNTVLYCGLAVVILYGGRLVQAQQLKVGTIIAFMSYFMQITHSLFMLNWMFNIYSRAMTSIKRIEEVIFMPIDSNQIVENEIELPESNLDVPEIEFRNVSFAYDGKKNSVENVSFKLYPGQSLGIMGATGSGKSTIIRLLLRQYDVDSGEILIRGVNIKNISHSELNKSFGSVFQKDFLFKGSIKANIDFGRNLDNTQLEEAILNAQASEFIDTKEDRLDHALASKGVNLSGGQQQRVLISRAFATKPEILILDDSSSALDFKTDSKLRQAIDEKFSKSTSIIVAQRISSVLSCDEIMFLENGKILAKGNHEYMLENCVPYKEIVDMQIGELE